MRKFKFRQWRKTSFVEKLYNYLTTGNFGPMGEFID